MGVHHAGVAEAGLVDEEGRAHHLVHVVDVAVGSQAYGDACVE